MLKCLIRNSSRIGFLGVSFILIITSIIASADDTISCNWDNPKELAQNGHFDGESENWRDLIRENRYDLYNIYEKYQEPGTYRTGTQHLIGLDFVEDNLDLLTERYDAATRYAKAVCDRELHDMASYKYFQILVDGGYFSTVVNFIDNLPQKAVSDTDRAELELRSKFKTRTDKKDNKVVKLKNVSSTSIPNRLIIKAKANNRNSRLFFDTGGDSTSYGYKFGKKAKFNISQFKNNSKTSNNRTYTSNLGFIDKLSLGSISLENVHVSLTPFKPNEFWWDGETKEKFDGLLGFDEIRKLGERIRSVVKNNRVDHISIDDLPP